MSQIYENLWIASAAVARERDFLVDNNITAVINCAEEESLTYPLPILINHAPLIDDVQGDASELIIGSANVLEQWLRQGKHVVVHCKAGISRSATVILAWMILHQGLPLDDAYELLQEKRPIIQPNRFYMRILLGLDLLRASARHSSIF